MRSLFKRKITPEQMGHGLVMFARTGKDIDAGVLEQLSQVGVDDRVGLSEIFWLKVLAIEFAVNQVVSESDLKDRICSTCLQEIEETFERASEGEALIDTMYKRLEVYSERSASPHPRGPAWVVGKTFMELCGVEEGAFVAMAGAIVFGEMVQAIDRAFKSYTLVDIQ